MVWSNKKLLDAWTKSCFYGESENNIPKISRTLSRSGDYIYPRYPKNTLDDKKRANDLIPIACRITLGMDDPTLVLVNRGHPYRKLASSVYNAALSTDGCVPIYSPELPKQGEHGEYPAIGGLALLRRVHAISGVMDRRVLDNLFPTLGTVSSLPELHTHYFSAKFGAVRFSVFHLPCAVVERAVSCPFYERRGEQWFTRADDELNSLWGVPTLIRETPRRGQPLAGYAIWDFFKDRFDPYALRPSGTGFFRKTHWFDRRQGREYLEIGAQVSVRNFSTGPEVVLSIENCSRWVSLSRLAEIPEFTRLREIVDKIMAEETLDGLITIQDGVAYPEFRRGVRVAVLDMDGLFAVDGGNVNEAIEKDPDVDAGQLARSTFEDSIEEGELSRYGFNKAVTEVIETLRADIETGKKYARPQKHQEDV